jgi:hypothetical protein
VALRFIVIMGCFSAAGKGANKKAQFGWNLFIDATRTTA